MAVYERTYRPYTGELTPQKGRFLVLPRYAFRNVFKSKVFIAYCVLCFISPLLLSLFIYVPHNATFIKTIETLTGGAVSFTFKPIYYLWWFMIPQGILAFFMSLIVGPALVSADMRNNGMPLYLSRPFSRTDYILGKSAVLVFLLSAITWVPGLLLFLLQSSLEGWQWFTDNLRTGFGILFSSWITILLLCLLSLALSAYMKWKPVAQAAYFGLILVTAATAGIVNMLFRTEWGSLLNISDMIRIVWAQAFGVPTSSAIPAAAAWASLLSFCGFCLLLLWRRVRAYEVVK